MFVVVVAVVVVVPVVVVVQSGVKDSLVPCSFSLFLFVVQLDVVQHLIRFRSD